MKFTTQDVYQYLDVCKTQKKLSCHTLKAYRIDLRQFLEFSAARKGGFDRETIKSYVSVLNETYQPRTVKRKLASLRALSTWMEEEGFFLENPFQGLRIKLRKPMLLPRTIPLRVIGHLLQAAHARLDAAPEDRAALCEAAVIELLFATGLRVSELCSLKTRDFDLTDGVLCIVGKGAKERRIQLVNREVFAVLRQYARVCRPEQNGTFFQNRSGGPLSDQSVRRILRKYARRIGEAARITPHMFRHSLATMLLEADVDIRYIQQLLGHASILTTQIYTHVAGAKQRDILTNSHPRNQLHCTHPKRPATAAAPEKMSKING